MAQLGLRKWGSQLTTIEQEKAKREQFRKDKLVALLNQKLHRAFGLTSSHPVIEEEIEAFVLGSKDDFSMAKLRGLQSDIAVRLAPEGIVPVERSRAKPAKPTNAAAKAGLGIVGLKANPGEARSPQLPSRGSRHSASMQSLGGKGPHGVRASQASNRSTSFKSLAESDEWREIQNFNTLLHLEEQNQEILRERERQRMIKAELDGQIREKKERQRQEQETERMYDELQRKLARDAERKEQQRIDDAKRKVQRDKEARDKQMIMERTLKQGETDRERAQEALLVSKLKKELELEKLAFREQKKTRKQQMADMMAENSHNQFLSRIAQQKEREEDKRLQKELIKTLEAQQSKEANDAKQREEKQQFFVARMASDVLAKVEEKARREEDTIRRYAEERDMKDKLEEERRLKKLKRDQTDMRDYLATQVKNKHQKDEIDKEVVGEQAKLWQLDREAFAREEAQLSQKMKDQTVHNQQLLQRQIDEARNKKKGMDGIEYSINKTYLKTIRAKKHEILKEGE